MLRCCEFSDLIIVHTEWNELLIDLKKVNKKKNYYYDLRNIYSSEK